MSQAGILNVSSGGGVVTSVTGANGVTASPTIGAVVVSGINALADGSTKGVATFNSTEFLSTVPGIITSQPISVSYSGGLTGSPSVNLGGTLTLGFSGGGSVVEHLTGNSGGQLNPDVNNNFNIIGTGNVNVSGTASTLTISSTDLHTARYIVSTGGASNGANYTTIASAIAAAAGTGTPQTVFIQPGTYTENLTLVAGVNLSATGSDGLISFSAAASVCNVIIKGTVTASYSGSCVLNGLQLKTNGAAALATSGANTGSLTFNGCSIFANDFTGMTFNAVSLSTSFYNCAFFISSANNLFAVSAGPIDFKSCEFAPAASSTASTISTSNVAFIACTMGSLSITTSTIGSVRVTDCYWSYGGNTLLTTSGTGNSKIYNSSLESTSASAVSIGSGTTVTISNCSIDSSNTNAITGAGILDYGNISFLGTSSIINTTTQIPKIRTNDAVKVTTPGAYPYTTIPQDAVILVDTSSARTIVPLASPTTGQMHRIKDSVGSAAANNITITPSGKNIDGSASYIISFNYGSIDIVYNGSEWSIL